MTTDQERRGATLARLHDVLTRARHLSHESLIMGMVIRYGSACRVESDAWDAPHKLDVDIAERAARRRYRAVERLVYGTTFVVVDRLVRGATP